MGLYMIALIYIVVFMLYSFKVIKYALAVRKLNNGSSCFRFEPRKVTILIPVRNEDNNIPFILRDLQEQDYPEALFQVFFIDDHSTDDTAEYLEKISSKKNNYHFFRMKDGQEGKKSAIDFGVKQTTDDWIIQTDADCRLPGSFISGHVSASSIEGTVLVAGAVKYFPSPGFFEKFERLEFYSLTGVTMGALVNKKPVMCNAANMSYSREFYLQTTAFISGHDHPSGDDIFLLETAIKMNRRINFLSGKNNVVSTNGTGNVKEFINQRIRWGSKAKYYRNFEMIFVTLLFFGMNFLLTMLIFAALFAPVLIKWAVLLWVVKYIIDAYLLSGIVAYFDQRALMRYFPLAALIYHFYLLLTGIISLIAKFSWKERVYN